MESIRKQWKREPGAAPGESEGEEVALRVGGPPGVSVNVAIVVGTGSDKSCCNG